MTTRTLEDSEAWLERLLQRMRSSPKTSTEDLAMCKYTKEIIQDRIREKREREQQP